MKQLLLVFSVFSATASAEWTSVNGHLLKDNLKESGRHVAWFLPPTIDNGQVILFEIHIFKDLQNGIPGVTPVHDSYINVWKINGGASLNFIEQIRFFRNQSAVHTIPTSNSPQPIEKSTLEDYHNHLVCVKNN